MYGGKTIYGGTGIRLLRLEKMKMKFELVKRLEAEQKDKTKYTFVFKPADERFEKEVTLKVVCEDPYATMGSLGLPQGIGDGVWIEPGAKEEQTKLSDIKEEDEKQ